MNLTPKQIQDGIDAAAALFRGEPIEYYSTNEKAWKKTHYVSATLHHRPVRKPEPRPWSKPEDVPAPICWLRTADREKDSAALEAMVVAVSPKCVTVYTQEEQQVAWHKFKVLEYSTDRKTWRPCVVEVAE